MGGGRAAARRPADHKKANVPFSAIPTDAAAEGFFRLSERYVMPAVHFFGRLEQFQTFDFDLGTPA